ncbi:MAG: SMC family ATPase [Planctomycetia bacterium]|nr:SMC family ATPase [Planctomycetia bacterium]
MIPQRIKLKGFLCYKEEQIIDFCGSTTLWMLSGLNGSGKSAIFDAVTYALFGKHRGGGSGAVELINKDSTGLDIEFDFLLDGHICRIKRTQKRDNKGGARGSQQIFHSVMDRFIPLEETSGKTGFDDWITNNIGLDYDTFTSSVLLLQGKAEKLLDSRPEGRREVLASIVNLEKYEKLHNRADERRKYLDTQVKVMNQRLAALPAVDPLELGAARLQIAEAEQSREAARAEIERLQTLETQSRLWQQHQAQLAQARRRYGRAKELLAESASIEKAINRLNELREVYPRLHEVNSLRTQHHQATQSSSLIESQRRQKITLRAERESVLKQAEERRRTLQQCIDNESRQERDTAERFRQLGLQLKQLVELERQEQELNNIHQERNTLPPDPASSVHQARSVLERLEAVNGLIRELDRFRTHREELIHTVAQALQAEQSRQAVQVRGTTLKNELETARKVAENATAALQQANERMTEARTLHRQAEQSLRDASLLGASQTCRHCGQALTPGHMEEELRRRTTEEKAAARRLAESQQACEAARTTEDNARLTVNQANDAYQTAREEYRDHNARVEQTRVEMERLQRECAVDYANLPTEQARLVSTAGVTDWTTTTYPTVAQVNGLRAEARGVETARRRLREAEATMQRFNTLEQRERLTRENLQRLAVGLPKNREALRQEHNELQASLQALFKSIDSGRASITRSEQEVNQLTRERDTIQQEINKADTDLRAQKLIQENAERGITAQLRALPEAWRSIGESVGLQQLNRYHSEREELVRQGIDDQARELEHARANVQVLHNDVEELQRQENNFPDEARQPSESIAAALRAARAVDVQTENQLASVRQHLMHLESITSQREAVDQELRCKERDWSFAKKLAELLGRDRLQLFLVRQAERQVVEFANAVLDRLSGGQLCLQLSGEAGGDPSNSKALELEAFNRATGDRPINVAFLSGSQKFRVAVSLALAIGQYASRQQRPIESVIIDEGFGCLDNQGRQVMIQELQNLRGQMRCILLVSHQEDFAEAFSDGYQFRLENGATRVTRFQR